MIVEKKGRYNDQEVKLNVFIPVAISEPVSDKHLHKSTPVVEATIVSRKRYHQKVFNKKHEPVKSSNSQHQVCHDWQFLSTNNIKTMKDNDTLCKFTLFQLQGCINSYAKRPFATFKTDSNIMEKSSVFFQEKKAQQLQYHSDIFTDLLLSLTSSNNVSLSSMASESGAFLSIMDKEDEFINLFSNLSSNTSKALGPFYNAVKNDFQRRIEESYRRGMKCLDKENSNKQVAFNYLKHSAKYNHVEAQYNLGICYHYGIGTTQSYNEADCWYLKAAKQGHQAAKQLAMRHQYFLTIMNKVKDDNDGLALYELAFCYETSNGVILDITKAKEYYHQSHLKGYSKATSRLNLIRNGFPELFNKTIAEEENSMGFYDKYMSWIMT